MDTPGPADPICSLCSKSFRLGELGVYEPRAFVHVRCRSQAIRGQAIESVAHAQATREHAPPLSRSPAAAPLDHPRPKRLTEGACPFCGRRATVMDWQPSAPWLA